MKLNLKGKNKENVSVSSNLTLWMQDFILTLVFVLACMHNAKCLFILFCCFIKFNMMSLKEQHQPVIFNYKYTTNLLKPSLLANIHFGRCVLYWFTYISLHIILHTLYSATDVLDYFRNTLRIFYRNCIMGLLILSKLSLDD